MNPMFTDQQKRDLFRSADTLRGAISEYWAQIGRRQLRVLTGGYIPQADTDALAVAYRSIGQAMPAVGRDIGKARRADVLTLQARLAETHALFTQQTREETD